MKKIFAILFLILLSGCTTNYNLKISNDSFEENISVHIDKSEIPSYTGGEVETDDQITPFLNNDYSALFSDNNAYYEKNRTDFDNYIQVDMNYNYSEEEFSDSNSLKLCFSDYEFTYEDSYYIHAYGEFYCLYSDDINISIETNNKVIKNNADSVNGNVYTWNVNKNNVRNVNIEFEVEKGFSIKNFIYYVLGAVVVIIVVAIICNIYFKRKKVNEI